MRVREATAEEIEALAAKAPWKFETTGLEARQAVIDERGEIMMAAGVKVVPEIYLFALPGFHPLVRMEAIRLLHSEIRDIVVPKGHSEGFAFVPPEIERAWGRHLTKWFGWEKTWPAYRVRDWKGEPVA